MKGMDLLLQLEFRSLQYKISLKPFNYDKDDPIEQKYEYVTRSEEIFMPD